MNLWDIKARFYRCFRSSIPFQWILEREIRGLRRLWDRVECQTEILLDVGTGVGSCLKVFPEDAPVVGVDHSYRMIRQVDRTGVFYGAVADAKRLPFRQGAFSLVAAIGLSEYVYDKATLLKEIKRVMADDGHLIITVARPNVLNMLRNLLGHRIHTIQPDLWELLIGMEGLSCVIKNKMWLQSQYLIKKIVNEKKHIINRAKIL